MISDVFALAEALGPKGSNDLGLKVPSFKGKSGGATAGGAPVELAAPDEGGETPSQTTERNTAATMLANSDLTTQPPTPVATPADSAAIHSYFAANPQMASQHMAPIPSIAQFLFGNYRGPLNWLSSKLPQAAQQEGVIPYAADQVGNLIGGE